MAPAPPPGASASELLLAVALTETGAGVVKFSRRSTSCAASIERPLLARATVTPTAAPAPMATLTVFTATCASRPP